MADVGIGALGYVGYTKEASEGAGGTPTKFIPATSVNFNDSNDYLTPLTIRGIRDTSVAMPAPYIVQGTVEMPLVSDDIALLLKSAFNASVVTSNYSGVLSAYTHAYTLSDSATQATMAVETATPGNLLVMRYKGCRVNTFELRAAFGEIVTATIGFDGTDRDTPSASGVTLGATSYATNSTQPFHFTGATVTGVSSVQNFTFGVNNNVEHIGVLAATRAYNRVALGQREITLTMTCDFQSNAAYTAMASDSELTNLAFSLSGPFLTGSSGAKASLIFTIPRLKYRTIGVPINSTDFVTQDIEFTVLKSTTFATQIISSLQLVNNESAATLAAGTTGSW